MWCDDFIDLAGAVGKVFIESGKQTRLEKEIGKLGIDMAASVIKDTASARENNLKAACEYWKNRVRVAANKHGLTKVVLISTVDARGNRSAVICMYGGNIAGFANELNICHATSGYSFDDLQKIQQLEKQFGEVIYEKISKA